jgi:tRNA pseudouridine38-40 synthase
MQSMQRYFIEVAYRGTNYSGFQVQQNANSVQAEVEKALNTYYRPGKAVKAVTALEITENGSEISSAPLQQEAIAPNGFSLTGSSRTDAGVHALQNYFHMDVHDLLTINAKKDIYHLNAILPGDIVIKNIIPVDPAAHCRFDAVSREYHYHIYQHKNPFLADKAYYYPYQLDVNLLQEAAAELMLHQDFTSFSKRNTQTHTFICSLLQSTWHQGEHSLVYKVKANRFLRGMVRGLTGTMLLVGRKKITLQQFKTIIQQKDCSGADFSVPGHGLFLVRVGYPDGLLAT